MKQYIFQAYDYKNNPIEIHVVAETKSTAFTIVRGICNASRNHINVDEGLSLLREVDWQ